MHVRLNIYTRPYARVLSISTLDFPKWPEEKTFSTNQLIQIMRVSTIVRLKSI